MTQFVVDACVAIKWVIPETQSEDAAKLLSSAHILFAPDLLLAEIGSVLWKKIRFGQISLAEGQQALELIQNSPLHFFETPLLLQPAFDLANQLGRSIYDCFYLALAIQQGCQMVTADEKLRNALQNMPQIAQLCWIEDL